MSHSHTTINLDTPLLSLGDGTWSGAYDNLDRVGDNLIDTGIVGQDWGEAMDRVARGIGDDATVRDLRDALIRAHFATSEEADVRALMDAAAAVEVA